MKRTVFTLALLSLCTGLSVFAADGDLIVNGNVGIGTTAPVGKFKTLIIEDSNI